MCELQRRTRNKKAKRYSYSQDCRPVARNICETCEVKEVVPRCEQVGPCTCLLSPLLHPFLHLALTPLSPPPSQESRLECTYKPEEKCMEKTEQYCYKQEVKTQEEVCDDKFVTYQL